MSEEFNTPAPESSPQPAPPPAPKRKWGRRLLVGFAVLLLLLILLVLLAPTIAGTAPVRAWVVGQANQQLNGQVSIGDWSLGWMSGVRLSNVKVYDSANALILEIPRLQTDLTLLNAARGKLDLGNTVIDVNATKVVIDEAGITNYQKLVREDPDAKKSTSDDSEPTTLLDIRGNITVNVLGGTIAGPRFAEAVHLTPGSINVNIPDLNATITNAVKLGYRVGEGPAGTIEASGAVDAFDSGAFHADRLVIGQKVSLKDVNLAAAAPFISPETPLHLRGLLDAGLDVNAKGLNDLKATGDLLLMNLEVADGTPDGQPLHLKSVDLSGEAIVRLDKGGALGGLSDSRLSLRAIGDQGALIDLDASAKDVNPSAMTATGIAANVNANLAAAQAQLGGWMPTGDLAVQNGTLRAEVAAASFDGKSIRLGEPMTANLERVTIDNLSAKKPILRDATVSIVIAGAIATGAEGLLADLGQLSVKSAGDWLVVEKSGNERLIVQLPSNGAPAGEGQLVLGADLVKLNALAEGLSGTAPVQDLRAGRFGGMLTLAKVNAGHSIGGDFTVSALSLGQLRNEKIRLGLRAAVGEDLSNISGLSADIISSFATLSAKDVRVVLRENGQPVGTFDMVRQATVALDVPSVPKLHALAQSFNSSAEPSQPLEITNGRASARMVIRDEGRTTSVDVSDLKVSDLSLARGQERYQFERPISLQLVAAIEADETVRAARVTKVSGDLGGIVELSMPQPISLGGLDTESPVADGGLRVAGTIERLAPLLAMLQGQPAAALPYRGEYVTTQNFATRGNTVTLSGQTEVADLAVLRDGQAVFSEKTLRLANDLSVDQSAKALTINTLSVEMQSSGALRLDVKGKVFDWEQKRQLQDVVATLSYDLAKLLPLVRPLLGPEQQAELADLTVEGKFDRELRMSGQFPADLPFNEAIKQLSATGGLAVRRISHPRQGIESLENLELPLSLANGKLSLTYADGNRRGQTPAPATFNGGTLALGGLVVDFGQSVPRLWAPRKHPIVRGVSINPLLGDTLGKYVNPVFANASRAKGQLDVTIANCEGLALDADVLKTPQSGKAVIAFSLTEMDIANPLGSLILGQLYGAMGSLGFASPQVAKGTSDVFRGDIRDAVVTIEAGRTTQQVTMNLIDPARAMDVIGSAKPPPAQPMPLTFTGDIRLSDLSQTLQVTFPTELAARLVGDEGAGKALRDGFPQGMPLTLRGTTTSPKVDWGNIVSSVLRQQLKSRIAPQLGDLLDRDKGPQPKADPVGELLDKLIGPQPSGDEPVSRDR